VVHWNLPSNPVDLEQREGRVHRYKNHAVRKNVAWLHGVAALERSPKDVWQAMFDEAKARRDPGESDLVPFWVYPHQGGAHIERHVPSLPLSREKEQIHELSRSLVLYRMAFGQPRQDDLLQYLSTLPKETLERVEKEARIDLTPRVPVRANVDGERGHGL
jgi:hypothetical protein